MMPQHQKRQEIKKLPAALIETSLERIRSVVTGITLVLLEPIGHFALRQQDSRGWLIRRLGRALSSNSALELHQQNAEQHRQ